MPPRKALLQLARDRLEKFYARKDQLDDPKVTDGVTFRLSKEDKSCGGDLVPLTFMEFEVENARPVDVFNVLMAAENQTQWDTAPSEMRLLGNWTKYQARGVVGFFEAKPLSTREIYEWQVASANFTSEEFWVVYSTLENDPLRSAEALRAGSTEMQNCLCAYRITATAKGVHVLNTQQINEHPWPLSARTVANAGWQTSAGFGSHLRSQGQKQALKGWASNETVAPEWMLKDEDDCKLQLPDLSLRDTLLEKAATRLTGAPGDWDNPKRVEKLADGQAMSIWQQSAPCGSSQAPLFRAEFEVKGAGPQEVFHAIAAKLQEARWNPSLRKLNLTGFHRGVRGIHEEFATTKILGLELTPQLFEWQAASHNASLERYLVAVESDEDPQVPSFDQSVVARQCLAAYEVVPGTADGKLATRVRMAQHLNPNAGLVSHFEFLWEKTAIAMLGTWASEVSEEARDLVAERHCGKDSCAMPGFDFELLELLAPPPLQRNESLTMADVLARAPKTLRGRRLGQSATGWQREFARLSLPHALNTTDLATTAHEAMDLFQLLQHNATEEERRPFARRASDAMDLQSQGEALASLQWRVLEAITLEDCNASLPDINGNTGNHAPPLVLLIGIAVAVLALLAGLTSCCCIKFFRMRRNRQARQAASLLLSAASSCAHSERHPAASEASTAASNFRGGIQ
ncbi:unnamed protein product [Effrenium voratum]|nr:unnamed protein product [Effrenium voratum]